MSSIDIVIIALYMVGMLFIGFYSNKKQKNSEDYFVAGRRAGVFSITCLWMSSWIGGASIVGTTSRAYDMGITAIWYVVIIAISLAVFSMTFAKIIKRISNKFHMVTYPDFIEQRYDSRTRIVATICTILGMIAFVASQFAAGGSILSAMTGWDLKTSFIIVAVVITLYTAFGGLLAVTYTDWFQISILFVGIVVLGVPLSISFLDGGIVSLGNLPTRYYDLGAWGWSRIIALGFSTLFSFFTGMDGFTRCIAAKDEKTARKGALLAAGGIFIIAIAATFLGLCAKLILPAAQDSSNALVMLIIHIFPAGLRGFIIVGIMAAIMSTADISMLTASANITKDIYQRYIRKNASERNIKLLGVVSSFVVGIIAAAFAWYRQDIIDILFVALTINSAGLFLPTLLGVFWKKANAKAAFYSITFSLIVILFWFTGSMAGWGGIFSIDSLWPGIIVSALIFFPVSMLIKQSKEEKEKIEEFMSSK